MTRALAAFHDTTYGGVYLSTNLDFTNPLAVPTWTLLATTGLANNLVKVMQVDAYDPYNKIYVQLDNDDIHRWNGTSWTKIMDTATARTLIGEAGGDLNFIAANKTVAGRLYLSVNTNGKQYLLYSSDYGANWSSSIIISYVALTGLGYISAAGNNLWLCYGHLYRSMQYSDDNGATWKGDYPFWNNTGGGSQLNINPLSGANAYYYQDSADADLAKVTYAAGYSRTEIRNGASLGTPYGSSVTPIMAGNHYLSKRTSGLERIVFGGQMYATTDAWANLVEATPASWGLLSTAIDCAREDENNALIGLGVGGGSKIYGWVAPTTSVVPWSMAGANGAAPYANSFPVEATGYVPTYGVFVGEGPASSGVYIYSVETDVFDYDHRPMIGDRSAHHTLSYPDEHAEDVAKDTPTIHNLWPVANGNIQVSDGSKWVETAPGAFGIHDPVTLDIDAALILDVTGQELGLDVQNANTVLAGPTIGAANEPTFRALVKADIPLASINLDDLGDVDMTGVITGDVPYKTAGDYKPYPLGLGTKIVVTSDKINFGNYSGGNYLNIDLTTGNLRLVGSATQWDDLLFAASVTKPGATAPSYKAFGPSGSLQALMFEASHHDEVHFEVQLPHRWKEGSKIYPHVHWTPTTADAGNVVWELEYVWANINGTFGAPGNMASDATAAGGTAWVHKMTRLKESGNDYIDGTGKTMSSMLVCRLHRNSNAGSDTLNKDVAMLDIDFHIEIDSFGSDTELVKDTSAALLLETGDYLLLETGDRLLLE